MSRLIAFDEAVSMMLRHKLLLVTVLCVGISASLFYALSLPREYETAAVIQIEQPSIQEPLAAGGSLSAATLQQLQIIEQRVMARENLLGIIRKFDLFSDLPDMSDSEKVIALRLAASVTQVSDPALQWRPDITPTALNITVRLDDAQLAADVANELVDNVLEKNRDRRSERARETLSFFEGEEQRIGNEIEALEAQIALFKQENADSLPGGISGMREQVISLREAELEIDRQIVELRSGVRTNENRVLANRILRLEEQRDLFRGRIAEVEQRIQRAPDIERTLSALERRLQKLSDQYQAITRGQAEAEMGLMLEASQQSESFIVLERAIAPDDPVSPNRKRIAAMGSVLSGLIGLALIFLLEMRNPVLRTEAQLERMLGLKAVAVIPTVGGGSRRRLRRILWGLGIAIVLSLLLAAVGR